MDSLAGNSPFLRDFTLWLLLLAAKYFFRWNHTNTHIRRHSLCCRSECNAICTPPCLALSALANTQNALQNQRWNISWPMLSTIVAIVAQWAIENFRQWWEYNMWKSSWHSAGWVIGRRWCFGKQKNSKSRKKKNWHRLKQSYQHQMNRATQSHKFRLSSYFAPSSSFHPREKDGQRERESTYQMKVHWKGQKKRWILHVYMKSTTISPSCSFASTVYFGQHKQKHHHIIEWSLNK